MTSERADWRAGRFQQFAARGKTPKIETMNTMRDVVRNDAFSILEVQGRIGGWLVVPMPFIRVTRSILILRSGTIEACSAFTTVVAQRGCCIGA
jgi:hypothetical protein